MFKKFLSNLTTLLDERADRIAREDVARQQAIRNVMDVERVDNQERDMREEFGAALMIAVQRQRDLMEGVVTLYIVADEDGLVSVHESLQPASEAARQLNVPVIVKRESFYVEMISAA